MKTDIIVVHWNEPKRLRKLVDSIFMNTDPGLYRLLLIDNGSQEDIRPYFESLPSTVEKICLDKNIGFAGAFNCGLKLVINDYVVRMDHDVIVAGNWLEQLHKNMRKTGADIIGPKIVSKEGLIFSAGSYVFSETEYGNVHCGEPDLCQREDLTECDMLIGACWLMNRKTLDCVGFTDENYFPAYAEDYDYCMAANSKELKIMYDGSVGIVHDHRKSAMKVKFQNKHEKENNRYFLRKWHPISRFRTKQRDARYFSRYALYLRRVKKHEEANLALERALAGSDGMVDVLENIAMYFLLTENFPALNKILDRILKVEKENKFANLCNAIFFDGDRDYLFALREKSNNLFLKKWFSDS